MVPCKYTAGNLRLSHKLNRGETPVGMLRMEATNEDFGVPAPSGRLT